MVAVALSMGVLVAWQYFFPAPTPEPSLVEVAPGEAAEAPAAAGTAAPLAPPPGGAIAPHELPLQLDRAGGVVSSTNGALRAVKLDDYKDAIHPLPFWSWLIAKATGAPGGEGGWSPYSGGDDPHGVVSFDGGVGLAGGGLLPNDDGPAAADGPSTYRVSQDGASIVALGAQANGLRIEKRFTPTAGAYAGELVVKFQNDGAETIPALWVGVAEQPAGDEPGFFNRAENIVHPSAFVDGDLETVTSVGELEGAEIEEFKGTVSWVGVGDRYFLAALMPQELAPKRVLVDQLPSGRWGSFYVDDVALAPGQARELKFKVFTGPKELGVLKDQAADLDASVEFGIFGFFATLLLWVLKFFHAGVSNWGLSIILLTLLVKLVFYTLNEKAYASSEKMKLVQPELQAIKDLYPDDQQRQSQETMKLWSKHGVSPLGGCLPMVVQMPIFFALYNVMYYSVELYGTGFLYIKDLTAADPTGIIPLIYFVLLVLQQQMTTMPNMDPAQQKMMKMMPFFFAFMMFSFPSGLVLYFCVNMFLTIVQQWLIRKKLQRTPATLAVATPQ